jgi:hypothetical protein
MRSAGFGTSFNSGCRGFTGPVPPPLWMSGQNLLAGSIVQNITIKDGIGQLLRFLFFVAVEQLQKTKDKL